MKRAQNLKKLSDVRYVRVQRVSCNARLFVEQNLDKKKILVKHWGIYTCPTKKRGRIDREKLTKLITNSPNLTREGITRQEIGRHVQRAISKRQLKPQSSLQIQPLWII